MLANLLQADKDHLDESVLYSCWVFNLNPPKRRLGINLPPPKKNIMSILNLQLGSGDAPIAGYKPILQVAISLPGGPAFCTEHRGDWKWQREALQLSAHWAAGNFCHRCMARKSGFMRSLAYQYWGLSLSYNHIVCPTIRGIPLYGR